jgi:predicted nucleic acid-binding Zn ribbon protein
MFGLFGKNRDKATRIISIVLGAVIIISMVVSYFALTL